MRKYIFGLVALLVFAGVAHAVAVTPVVSRNTYINTTAEQIDSSGNTKCRALRICNSSTSNKAGVKNSSGLTTTNGYILWPNAGTATVDSRCIDWPIPQYTNGAAATVDSTTFYGVAITGTVQMTMICTP